MSRTKDSPSLPGLRKQRRISRPDQTGTLFLWDCAQGAPMEVGADGERWAIEHRPGGKRAKRRHLHFPNFRIARFALAALAGDGEDEWGFFSGHGKQDGGQTQDSPGEGGGPASLALSTDVGFMRLLRDEFPESTIISYLRDLCEAEKGVYSYGVETAKEPDWATREKGLKLLLAYREGLPVQRKEEVSRRESSDAEVMEKVAMKPGYRRAWMNYCAAIERQEADRLDDLRKTRETTAKGRVVDGADEEPG